MAKSQPKGPSAKARARDAAREEAARIKAEQEAKRRRSRTITIGSVVGGIVVTVALVIVILTLQPSTSPDALEVQPAGATASGGIVLGTDGVAGGEAASGADVVTVDIYSDYMCPFCAKLDLALAETLAEMRAAGEIRLVVHPVAILDRLSKDTQYSTRAANAAATVAKYAPESFLEYHNALFENQPEENSEGLDDAKLVEIATDLGMDADVTDRFVMGEMNEWVAAATESASRDGLTGTPRVTLTLGDGKAQEWEKSNTGDIKGAVQRVKDGGKPDNG
jgi:protein-disulfide isomerase